MLNPVDTLLGGGVCTADTLLVLHVNVELNRHIVSGVC